MLGRDAAAFGASYRSYFERNSPGAKEPKTMFDPAPRMVLDPKLGFAAIGRTAREAAIVEDLYDHTIDVILRAEALGGWQALAERHIFDVEYWDLEQAKLKKELATPIPVAHALQEGGTPKSDHVGFNDVRVHLRGRYDRLGDVVPRRFPRILAGDQQLPIKEGSGRAQLAVFVEQVHCAPPSEPRNHELWYQSNGEIDVHRLREQLAGLGQEQQPGAALLVRLDEALVLQEQGERARRKLGECPGVRAAHAGRDELGRPRPADG